LPFFYSENFQILSGVSAFYRKMILSAQAFMFRMLGRRGMMQNIQERISTIDDAVFSLSSIQSGAIRFWRTDNANASTDAVLWTTDGLNAD